MQELSDSEHMNHDVAIREKFVSLFFSFCNQKCFFFFFATFHSGEYMDES